MAIITKNNQILHVLNNPDEAKEKVIKGQKYILDNLTWDKVVKKVESAYEECISKL